MSFILGYANTSYTHHQSPINILDKDGRRVSFPDVVKRSLPPCRLNPLLFNGHLQTMWTAVKEAGPSVYYKRKIFESTHAIYPGQFTVDFVVPEEIGLASEIDELLPERTTWYSKMELNEIGSEDEIPMLIALHGLSGGSHEVYLREVIAPMTARGWAACVVNGRGCAESKITTPRLFNARATWDTRQLVQYLRYIFPRRPLYAVGFSLGANILTNYIGEEGAQCIFRAAVACSNPWNLEVCNVELQRSLVGREVYSKIMGKNMLALYEKHREILIQEERVDAEAVQKVRHLYEFDRMVQAPTFGYPTEGAYYRDAQSCDALTAVKVPFLAINATDDPISANPAIPYQEFLANPYTILCTTDWGGHLSWFGLGGKRWFAIAIASFFDAMYNEIDWKVDLSKSTATEAVEELPVKKYPVFDSSHRRLLCPLE